MLYVSEERRKNSERNLEMSVRDTRAEVARLKKRNNVLASENKDQAQMNEDQEREIASLRSQLSQLRKQRGLSHE